VNLGAYTSVSRGRTRRNGAATWPTVAVGPGRTARPRVDGRSRAHGTDRCVREDGRTPPPLSLNLDRILDRDPLPYPDRIANLEPSTFADDGFAVVVHTHQVT